MCASLIIFGVKYYFTYFEIICLEKIVFELCIKRMIKNFLSENWNGEFKVVETILYKNKPHERLGITRE